MPEVSERTLAYVRSCFESRIAGILDDPSDFCHPWRDCEPPEAIAELRGMASELGLDFDALVALGTPYEQERLRSLEDGTLKPSSPREPIPQSLLG
jgi:hypothetical protein